MPNSVSAWATENGAVFDEINGIVGHGHQYGYEHTVDFNPTRCDFGFSHADAIMMRSLRTYDDVLQRSNWVVTAGGINLFPLPNGTQGWSMTSAGWYVQLGADGNGFTAVLGVEALAPTGDQDAVVMGTHCAIDARNDAQSVKHPRLSQRHHRRHGSRRNRRQELRKESVVIIGYAAPRLVGEEPGAFNARRILRSRVVVQCPRWKRPVSFLGNVGIAQIGDVVERVEEFDSSDLVVRAALLLSEDARACPPTGRRAD